MMKNMALLIVAAAAWAGEPRPAVDRVPPIPVSERPARLIENFDDGEVVLGSYPGEDAHPDSWRLDTLVTRNRSRYSLRLHGNTWKTEAIEPMKLDSASVWQVSAYVYELGEIQGFGLIDSAHSLLYAFAGTEKLDPGKWVTVYQGAFAQRVWNDYRLPVGDDWLARFGYLPRVTGIVFVNDRDTDPRAVVYFDDVLDISGDLPVAPRVEAWYETGRVARNRDGSWSVTVRFYSRVTDPDSPEHDYYWSFGDGAESRDSCPVHTYVVRDDHEYTALLEVVDTTGLWGRAACRVVVDPGPTTFPVRMNFVGDMMLARRYELPGGLIDTLGPEGIFEPIRPYLAGADLTVANLECPLAVSGTPHPTKPIIFKGRPTNVAGFVHAGIDVVTLANNHILDYGLAAITETESVLSASGIRFSGAGANSYQAYRPVFAQKSGVNVAFLGFCDRTGQYDNYQPYLNAGYNKPGFAMLDTFHVFGAVRVADTVADLVVVQMHSGEEYKLAPVDEDEFYSPFALVPSDSLRVFRRRTLDQGADLVVCHHPHVLQGFEVHRGRLVAHSLGNFAFDQEYPETYPSVILDAAADLEGFRSFSLTPVYVDDYIPRRARGNLGRHILDYLARRSRELATRLAVNRDSVCAEVVLDTTGLVPLAWPFIDVLPLRQAGGWWTSGPRQLARRGSISALNSIMPRQNWQYRLGREVVWFGSFEDEGSTLWNLNQADEFYDTVACQGRRSLAQTRTQGSGAIATSLEERLVCYSDTTAYTLYGHVRTQNARDAGVTVNFYSVRSGSSPIGSSDLGTVVSGTTGWTFYHREFVPTSGTRYTDLALESRGPSSGTGRAWFDSTGIVEWSEWRPFTGREAIAEPNDYYWLEVRTNVQTAEALVGYEEANYEPPTAAGGGRTGPAFRDFRCFPNPGARPMLAYTMGRPGRVVLKVYDVTGREVRTLVDRNQETGPATVAWDRKDSRGRRVGPGAYFCKLRAGGSEAVRKIVLVE